MEIGRLVPARLNPRIKPTSNGPRAARGSYRAAGEEQADAKPATAIEHASPLAGNALAALLEVRETLGSDLPPIQEPGAPSPGDAAGKRASPGSRWDQGRE